MGIDVPGGGKSLSAALSDGDTAGRTGEEWRGGSGRCGAGRGETDFPGRRVGVFQWAADRHRTFPVGDSRRTGHRALLWGSQTGWDRLRELSAPAGQLSAGSAGDALFAGNAGSLSDLCGRPAGGAERHGIAGFRCVPGTARISHRAGDRPAVVQLRDRGGDRRRLAFRPESGAGAGGTRDIFKTV